MKTILSYLFNYILLHLFRLFYQLIYLLLLLFSSIKQSIIHFCWLKSNNCDPFWNKFELSFNTCIYYNRSGWCSLSLTFHGDFEVKFLITKVSKWFNEYHICIYDNVGCSYSWPLTLNRKNRKFWDKVCENLWLSWCIW